jgi:Immunoglobulin domain
VLSLGSAELTAVTGLPFDYAEYTRVAIAPVGTVTVRARLSMINAYDVTGAGDPPLVTDKYTLTAVGAPDITTQPGHASVSPGENVTFTVDVSNPPVSYQWQFNNTDLVNGGSVSGATSKTLTITGVSAANVGHYRARVSNSVGTVTSTDGTLAIVGINFYPVVTIQGKIGDTYQVDYATAIAPTTWLPLSTVALTTSPQLVIDAGSPGSNTRFYKAVYVP